LVVVSFNCTVSFAQLLLAGGAIVKNANAVCLPSLSALTPVEESPTEAGASGAV
jgi:hypothetical protein